MEIIMNQIKKLLVDKNISIIACYPGAGKRYFFSKEENQNRAVFIPYISYLTIEELEDEDNPITTPEELKVYSDIEFYKEILNQAILGGSELKYIFVTAGKKMIQKLNKYNLPYSVIIPGHRNKAFYIEKRLNGYSEDAIKLISENWHSDLTYIENNALGDIYLFEVTDSGLSSVINNYFK